jgi:hypothetical protein
MQSAPKFGRSNGSGIGLLRRGRVRFGLALALLWPVGAAAEWSDDPDAPGRAASHSYRTAQGAVAVRPLDNSTLNIGLAEQIAAALRRRGIAVADDAPLLLEFETATEDAGAPLPRRGRPWEPRRVQTGRDIDVKRSDNVDAHVDVFSTMHSSVLTGIRKPAMGLRYVLRATLSERAGARLWDGYTQYGGIGDEDRIFATMAPLLAGMVGQTTGERRFRAD